VAAPPAKPPIAEINPPRSGDSTPAAKPAKAGSPPAATDPLWVDDSDTEPTTPKKRRFGRRSGPADEPG
jgi:hypothetical protein